MVLSHIDGLLLIFLFVLAQGISLFWCIDIFHFFIHSIVYLCHKFFEKDFDCSYEEFMKPVVFPLSFYFAGFIVFFSLIYLTDFLLLR